jgi:hypothetical protein
MSDPISIAYFIIRTGWISLVVFGALLLVPLTLAVLDGRSKMMSMGRLCCAGFLAALALLSGGALLEGVLSGEIYFILRKNGGLVKLSESPGWYWASVTGLGLVSIGMLAVSAVIFSRVVQVGRTAPHET